MTASPRVSMRACIGERTWPKFRAFTMTLTLWSCAAIRFSTATVPSLESLSMKMCSYRYPPTSRMAGGRANRAP